MHAGPRGPLRPSVWALSEPTRDQGRLPAPVLALFSPETRQLSAVCGGPKHPQSQARPVKKQGPYRYGLAQPQLRPGRAHPRSSFGSPGRPRLAQRHHAS
eukprot:6284063-Amphidinium_carterae.2